MLPNIKTLRKSYSKVSQPDSKEARIKEHISLPKKLVSNDLISKGPLALSLLGINTYNHLIPEIYVELF